MLIPMLGGFVTNYLAALVQAATLPTHAPDHVPNVLNDVCTIHRPLRTCNLLTNLAALLQAVYPSMDEMVVASKQAEQ